MVTSNKRYNGIYSISTIISLKLFSYDNDIAK